MITRRLFVYLSVFALLTGLHTKLVADLAEIFRKGLIRLCQSEIGLEFRSDPDQHLDPR